MLSSILALMKSIVVAYDRKRGIGASGDLPWGRDLPADLAHFKALTVGKSIIMGHTTFESIGRPLPDRQNIVLSRSPLSATSITVAGSLRTAYELAEFEPVIIGGESVFREALPDVDTIYATEVDAEFREATVFFPKIDNDGWREVAREHHDADTQNKYAFDFVTYQRP